MNVKKLKLALILLLVVANAFFAVLIGVNFRSKNYYDAETIKNAYRAIENGNINVAFGILESRQQSFSVYMSEKEISSCDDILSLYGERASSDTAEDTTIISDGGVFQFGRGGSFFYKSTNDYTEPMTNAVYSDVSSERKTFSNMKKIVREFLKLKELSKCASNKKSKVDVDVILESVFYEASTETYTVTAYQTFSGEKISDSGMMLIIHDGNVTRASGTFSFVYPTKKIFAECIDALNILFLEKDHFKDEKHNGIILSDITYFYSVYDSADGKRYFIPMCRVYYNKQELSGVYNLVSHKRES